MKNTQLFKISKLVLLILISTSLLACGNKNTVSSDKPSIIIHEVGLNNSSIAYPASNLHLDAGILALGILEEIQIQISHKTDKSGWTIEQSYRDYQGQKDVGFHRHIRIPRDAPLGAYTLVFIVRDAQGQKTACSINFEIRPDPNLPIIQDLKLKIPSSNVLQWSEKLQGPRSTKHDIHVSYAPPEQYQVQAELGYLMEMNASYPLHFDKP